MSRTVRGALVGAAAAASGLALAIGVGSAGANTNAAPITTTLGSTTGTPSQNICAAGINCTYVPFSSASNPTLQVPVDGNVTGFSVNAGSAGGTVQLRVLRPAPNGQFTGAATGPAETLAAGPNTFSVSVPVHAGDVLALDNSSSALLFDTSTANPVFTAYYQLPALADGSTAAPNNNKMGYRLLLSATVTGTTPTTTTTTNGTTVTTTVTGGTTTVTKTVTKTVPAPPIIGNPTQSSSSWRRKNGTTFAFGLSTSAKVHFQFRQKVGKRTFIRGTLVINGHPGTNRVQLRGRVAKSFRKGRYLVTITATSSSGTSRPVSLSFTITA
jgi:hypothetical protein